MKKIFMLALAAVTLLASCSKDEKGGDPVDEGGNAALRMKITLPNATTRAGGEHETLAAESTIEDIYIYVFNNDGTPANDSSNGRFGPFDLTNDFDQQLSPNDNIYNMKNPVTTTAGTKKIYVVVNLEENGLAINYGSEQIFLNTIAEVHGDGGTPGLVKFDDATLGVNAKAVESIVLMGNETQTLTSVASGSGDNEVNVDIERTVGRVVTTLNNSLGGTTITKDWHGTGDLKFEIRKYFITQDAYKSYLGPNFYTNSTRVKTLISITDPDDETTWAGVINGPYDPDEYLLPTPGSKNRIT